MRQAKGSRPGVQHILVNLALTETLSKEGFAQIRRALPPVPGSRRRVGIAAIFSYLREPRAVIEERLRLFLRMSAETDAPVLVQLDGEQWWDGAAGPVELVGSIPARVRSIEP